MRIKTKGKPMRKKWGIKRKISLLLLVMQVISSIPNLNLMIQVMANPNAGEVAVGTEADGDVVTSEELVLPDDLREEGFAEEKPIMAVEPFVEANFRENRLFVASAQMEREVLVFEPMTIPDEISYDEIYEEDRVISTHSTITDKKILYKGNLTIDANVDFKDAIIRVEGTVTIQKGFMKMEDSSVLVDGDVRIQAEGEDGTYQITDGYMNVSTDATVRVKGDFYTESTNSSNQINSKGTLELEGNFIHIGDTYFRTYGTYLGRLLFIGEGEQHLSFGQSKKVFMDGIFVANKLGKLYVDTRIPYLRLMQNISLAGGDIEIGALLTEGYDLTIEGNYLINENSTLYHTDTATLFIEGDFRIQSKPEDGSYGETAEFMRISSNGKIVVKGDFYTQSTNHSNSLYSSGILELHGNFNHIGDTWFGGGNLVFAGEREQHISFGETTTKKTKIGSLIVNNQEGKLHVDTRIPLFKLTHNTIFTGADVELEEWNGQGYDLKIEGNYLINEGTKSSFSNPGSSTNLFITGDLRVQSKDADGTYGVTNGQMYIGSGFRIIVEGDFYTESANASNGVTAAGILELHGDLVHIGDTYFNEPKISSAGTVLFAGDGEQQISIGNADKFGYMKLSQSETSSAIVVDGPTVNTLWLASDVIFGGPAQVGSLMQRGYTAHFKGAATFTGYMGVEKGALICEDDVTLKESGGIYPTGGAVSIKGNLYMEGNGRLSLHDDRDLVVIFGDVQNASMGGFRILRGLLDLKGDYIQSTMTPFETSGNSMVQFSSPDHQTISFPEGAKVWFYNLGLDPGLNYTFSKEPVWTNSYRAYDTNRAARSIAAKHFGKAGTNGATGNYSQSFSDLAVPNVIGPLNLTHTYNSLSEFDGVLGKGFVFSHNMKLESEEIMGKEQVLVTLPNGAQQSFIKHAKGIYEAQDSRGVLTKEGSLYILTSLDQTRTIFHENGTILSVEDRVGNKLNYQVGSDGNITSIQDLTGTHVSIEYSGGKIQTITNHATGDQASFTYVDNRLVKSVDGAGKSTAYEYDSTGLLSKIINHDGSSFEEITYIGEGKHEGKVFSVKNIAENISTYVYEDSLRRTTITDSNGRQMIQEYDLNSYITSTIDALGQRSLTNYVISNGQNQYGETASETDIFGNTTSYTRDVKGNITRISYPDGSGESFTYDARNNVSKAVDKNGAATYFIYDANGKNLLKKSEPINGILAYSESVDQNLFAISRYTYDDSQPVKGLVITETSPLGDEENYIKNEYNNKGQVVKQTVYMDGTPYTTTKTYNAKNFPIRETAPDGVVTELVYNRRDEIIRKKIIRADGKQETVERTLYDSLGRKILTVSPLEYEAGKDNITEDSYSGVGTEFTYDLAGNILTQTNALGHKTSYRYDLYGNVLAEILPNGSYSEAVYDERNRKISGKFHDSIDGETRTLEEVAYAQSGKNLKTVVTAYLDENRFAVTTAVTDYEERTISATNAEGNTIRKTYTKGGEVATETDVFGKNTSYSYDIRGNLICKTTPFEGGATAKTTYTYDKMGNPLSEVIYNNKVGEGFSSTQKTAYHYDAWGNVLTVAYYDGEEAASYVQAVYDFRGRVLRQYKGLSRPLVINGLDDVTTGNDEEFSVIRYIYNYLDKPVEVTNALGEIESSHYDAAGNLISGVDYTGGTYEAVYDILGRIESEEKYAPGKTTLSKSFVYDEMSQIRSVTENEKTNTFEYDGKGLVIREEDDLVIKEFQYDYTGAVLVSKIYEESELLKETRTAYDKMSRPVTISDGSVLKATYSYDKGSRLIGTKYGNGLTEIRTYNDAGLTKSVVNKDHAGAILSQYSYTYAVDGNQRSKTDAGGLTEYGYDGLNRLVEEKHTSGADITTSRYFYDENGNMTKKEVVGYGESVYEHYSYNEADQLMKQTGTKGQVFYSYDNNGNMLTKRTNGETETQTYDARNRLISWTDGEVEADYTYHINNKRASKMVDGLKTEHIWIGEEIQIDKTDGEMISYVHGIRLIESEYGFYLYNAHGDVVQVVQENQIVSRYDYNAYGQMIGEYAEDENDHNPYRYAGEYQDKETEYIYLRARYYDPEISRFLNVDPIRDGMNWYGYTGGNPVRYTDPSGLRRKGGAGIALGSGATGDGGGGERGKVSPPKEDPELSVKKSQGGITKELAASLWWLMATDGPFPLGDMLYGGILGVSATMEYGPAVVHTVGTYGPAIIDGAKQGVTSAVEWGIEGVNTYGPILRDQAIQATERIFGSGVAVGGSDAITAGLGDIAGKYGYRDMDEEGYGKCETAAQEMIDYLKKNKQHGELITLMWSPRDSGIIWSGFAQKSAGYNGLHIGVLYNGVVFCNVHPYGLPEQQWIDDFTCLPPAVKLPPIRLAF